MNKCWCGNEVLDEYSQEYYQCKKCHTLVSKKSFEDSIVQVENEEEDLYGYNYWEQVMVKESNVTSIDELIDKYIPERALYWVSKILQYIKLGGKAAEVGCGLGQLSYLMDRLNYMQTAYELSPQICEFLHEKLGLHMICGELKNGENDFDAVIAMDVFEHVINSVEFARNAYSNLTEQGILVMQMPCYDYALSYNEMLEKKPRFAHLLVPEQHVYLYSKEAVTHLLEEVGFKHIIFEPAFFGDDYDMFLFASKSEIKQNTKEEIEEYLNTTENGRLVKALMALFEQNRDVEKRYEEADTDRNLRQTQIEEIGERLAVSEADRTARLEQIEKLNQLLEESEADRSARLEQTEQLTRMLEESELDRAARLEQIEKLTDVLSKKGEDRKLQVEQVEKLTETLQESEADRTARLEQIEKLTGTLQESEADRTARLEQIEKLTETLQESEADRTARLEQIEKLTETLQESEADRTARLEQIEKLTKSLQECEADRMARLEQIEKLTKSLQESENDRAARLGQIEELTVMVEELSKKKRWGLGRKK